MSSDAANEWRVGLLGDLTNNFDSKRKPVKEADRRSGPYPYYGASGIVDSVDDYLFDGDYLLVAEDGENLRTRQTPIAFMAAGKFWVNNHAHIITGNEHADTRFLMYALQGADINGYITGAVMPKLTQGNLNAIEIAYPPLKEQRAIAHILGTLDDKIELNRKQNETLEAMARALFKAWFVDFEPVRAKLEGRWQRGQSLPGLPAHLYDLFPDRLVESELGEIPEGWRVARAGDIYDVGIGKTPPRKEQHWFTKDIEDMPWASIKDMGDSGLFIGKTSEYLTSNAVDAFNIRLVPAETVLLSFKLTVGRLAITDSEMTTNEAIAHFKSKESSPPQTFLWCYLRQFDFTQLGSTSSIATATNSKAIREMPILQPSKELVEKFDEASSSLFQQIRSLQHQSHSLAQLRDTLLPKLISGELRVKDAERMASSATGDPVSI